MAYLAGHGGDGEIFQKSSTASAYQTADQLSFQGGVHRSLDDETSEYHPPPMTYSSSRSTSSSVTAYTTDGEYSAHPDIRRTYYDTESPRYQQSEAECVQSPLIHSSTISDSNLDEIEKSIRNTENFFGTWIPDNQKETRSTVDNEQIRHSKFEERSPQITPVPSPSSAEHPRKIYTRQGKISTANIRQGKVRTSLLRDTLVSTATNRETFNRPSVIEEDESSESDDDRDSDDENSSDYDSDDNEWSGENTNFEASILEALGHDFELAAHIIPLMRILDAKYSAKSIKRVGSWRYGVTKYTTDSGTPSSGKTPSNEASSSPNDEKRKRNGQPPTKDKKIEEKDDEDEEDEDERNSKRLKSSHSNEEWTLINILLACPYHKLQPNTYGIHHTSTTKGKKGRYRSCAGPGFKSIARLKEHLRRKHTHVQCGRCYHIFEDGDHATRVAELQNHLKLPESCPRNPDFMKEGIDEAQWAKLDAKKTSRNGRNLASEPPKTNVERWNEIWQVLFPDKALPATPWYDQAPTEFSPQTPSQGAEKFLQLVDAILTHRTTSGDMNLLDGTHSQFLDVSKKAFELWSTTGRWLETSSSSISASARSNQQTSLLSGSYMQISNPDIVVEPQSLDPSSPTLLRAQMYQNTGSDEVQTGVASILVPTPSQITSHTDQNMVSSYVSLSQQRRHSPNYSPSNLITNLTNSGSHPSASNYAPGYPANLRIDQYTNLSNANNWGYEGFIDGNMTGNSAGFEATPGNINQEMAGISPGWTQYMEPSPNYPQYRGQQR